MACSPQIDVSDFSEDILDKTISFKVIRMNESFFVWVGSGPSLSNMAVAMPATPMQIPTSTTLFGSQSDLMTSYLASKLAKKFSKQVFVSCSVPFDQQLSLLIEKRLAQELKLNPV